MGTSWLGANLQAVNALQSYVCSAKPFWRIHGRELRFQPIHTYHVGIIHPLFVPHLVSVCEMTSSPQVYIINNPNIDFRLAVTSDPSIHDSERFG